MNPSEDGRTEGRGADYAFEAIHSSAQREHCLIHGTSASRKLMNRRDVAKRSPFIADVRARPSNLVVQRERHTGLDKRSVELLTRHLEQDSNWWPQLLQARQFVIRWKGEARVGGT